MNVSQMPYAPVGATGDKKKCLKRNLGISEILIN
jgi:hypothetical protein